MAQSVDNLYYSLVVKVSIANKSRLFVKNMLQYGQNQQFTVADQVSLLYMNVNQSLL